jgi:hypothetical protein
VCRMAYYKITHKDLFINNLFLIHRIKKIIIISEIWVRRIQSQKRFQSSKPIVPRLTQHQQALKNNSQKHKQMNLGSKRREM